MKGPAMSSGNHGSEPAVGLSVHVVPLRVLTAVWVALLILTGLTTAVSYVDWGRANLLVAMTIATAKATLVVLFFMHLKYDHKFNALVLLTALLFITLFIALTLIDSSVLQYRVITEGR
jgi:cytochrome c oxidase subunit 4